MTAPQIDLYRLSRRILLLRVFENRRYPRLETIEFPFLELTANVSLCTLTDCL